MNIPAPPLTAVSDIPRKKALGFVIFLGVVSLLADMTYEGARSIAGPFLATLGASGTIVGIVAGFGELVGYGLRLASGLISDRTKRYWTITVFGYIVNLAAVPLLALAGRWDIAAALLIAERVGKTIRTPARDAMLSQATSRLGAGWAFGLHEALDQTGAVVGPLIVAAVLHARGSYRAGFAVLLIPALMAIAVLLVARALYPRPRDLEPTSPALDSEGFPRGYWLYLGAVGLVAAGYVDFPLIAYHFQHTAVVSQNWIPVFYAVAMGVDAVAALVFGHLFDRIGISALVAVSLISSLFAPLTFLGDFRVALLGMALWGVGMGAQESVMRAAVAGMVSADRRGSAYGLFNAGYGLAWFMGSALLGVPANIDRVFRRDAASFGANLPRGKEASAHEGAELGSGANVKIAVLSDIHGNLEALQAITEPWDELWVLGDLVNYGPNAAEVVDFVRRNATVVVRGNHDHATGAGEDPPLLRSLPQNGASDAGLYGVHSE